MTVEEHTRRVDALLLAAGAASAQSDFPPAGPVWEQVLYQAQVKAPTFPLRNDQTGLSALGTCT